MSPTSNIYNAQESENIDHLKNLGLFPNLYLWGGWGVGRELMLGGPYGLLRLGPGT